MMLQFLHISRFLDKQLAALRKAGKKAELAAVKCEGIFADIKRFGCQAEVVAGKRTRNGEQRIRNCVKYDLGGGYRLITIRCGCHLLALFAGTHDEADQWIERHRYDDFAPDDASCRSERIELPATPDPAGVPQLGKNADNDADAGDEYEAALQRRLDETRLKVVFQGLFIAPSVPAAKKDVSGRHGG